MLLARCTDSDKPRRKLGFKLIEGTRRPERPIHVQSQVKRFQKIMATSTGIHITDDLDGAEHFIPLEFVGDEGRVLLR
jgi:hypothetical protein